MLEGGVLVVSPAPGVAHQRASYWLHHALAQAAASAAAGTEVLEAVNVAMPGNKLLVPDVVVVAAEAIDETATRIPSDAVLAVVEVVSASTISIDRAIKPAMYAEAAIPVYWRVELPDTPRIVVSTVSRGATSPARRSPPGPPAASRDRSPSRSIPPTSPAASVDHLGRVASENGIVRAVIHTTDPADTPEGFGVLVLW